MSWGAGPALGLLTLLGYLVCMIGAVFFWRYRDDFFVWIQDEADALRRNFSRHVMVGPFYTPREESRLWVISTQVLRSRSHIPSLPICFAAFLFFVGVLLFVLDFFI